MIEAGVAVTERVRGVETRLGVSDGQTVCHAVGVVDVVSRRHVDDGVVLNKVVDLRAPQLGEVPVGAVDVGHGAAHNGLNGAWHLPALAGGVENVREAGGGTWVGLVVVNVRILILSQSVRRSPALNVGNGLCQCVSSAGGQFGVVLISDTILRGTGLCSLLVQRRSSPEQHLA